MSDQLTSIIRTAVPYAVGYIAALLARHGITLDEDALLHVSGLLTAVIGLAYYVVVRQLEARWPQLGVLLGKANQPVYKKLK